MRHRNALLFAILLLGGCSFAVDGAGASGDPAPVPDPQPTPPATTQSPPTTDDGGAPAATVDAAPPDDLTPTGPTAPPPGVLGDPCDPMHPCVVGLTCVNKLGGGGGPGPGGGGISFPGGLCTADCSVLPCVDGQCAHLQGGDVCVAPCGGGCRKDYVCCNQGFNPPACVPNGTCD
jgi:hypothetical protein